CGFPGSTSELCAARMTSLFNTSCPQFSTKNSPSFEFDMAKTRSDPMQRHPSVAAPLSPEALQERYAFAQELAMKAARRALGHYKERDSLVVGHKGDQLQDLVSIVDQETEAFIKQQLAEQFPDDGFLGEETGGATLDARCIWVVDPIDGTRCFVNGLHAWCVSI